MMTEPVTRTVSVRLEEHDDLFHGIIRIALEHNLTNARITGNGTVRRATLATYDQKLMAHAEVTVDEPMEILSMYGTFTLRGGTPYPQIHLVLSDADGNGKGGLLLPDSTSVITCEIVLEHHLEDDLHTLGKGTAH